MGIATKLSAGLIIIGAASSSAVLLMQSQQRQSTREVCTAIDKDFYLRESPRVQNFVKQCFEFSENWRFVFSRSAQIQRLNQLLCGLAVSHLTIFSPERSREIWENSSLDTGIRARLVQDRAVVIFRVVNGSPAEKADLKKGDEILSLNDRIVTSPDEIREHSGIVRYRRQGKVFSAQLGLDDVSEDLGPLLTTISSGKTASPIVILKLESFLPQYFEVDRWQSIVGKLSQFQRLIIDLRGNAGGSFPAMLRALSPFRCSDPVIGYLRQAEKSDRKSVSEFPDRLDVEAQLQQLDLANRIRLKTFSGYACFKGEVSVLIDEQTASVAEIFAEALSSRARLFGKTTSGQVVLAKWIPLPSLGNNDFSISIPIADYESTSGRDIEGEGVHPKKDLEYSLRDELSGVDSWIAAVIARETN